MRLLRRFIHSSREEIIITTSNKNNRCIDCKHLDFNGYKCQKFGKYNFIRDNLEHLAAKTCRLDKNKCGESAKFHQKLSETDVNRKINTFLFYHLVVPISFGGVFIMICMDTFRP